MAADPGRGRAPADEHEQEHEQVIVVGGGYAGLHAARAARAAGSEVTIVDSSGSHDFVTRLAAVAGGAAPLCDASAPLEEFHDRVEAVPATKVGDGVVELADGRVLEAAAVVVTTGAEVSRPPIEGIGSARGLRDAHDAALLRGLIASADSLVVVGGGATGVQLAGAAASSHRNLRVHLVEAGDRLLPGLHRSLGAGAQRILSDRGVEVRLGVKVQRFTEAGVSTTGGELEGLVVWAGGYSADASRLGLPVAGDGRVRIGEDLLVEGMSRTFAAGDVAAHLDRHGSPLPMSAQVAVRAGSAAGANAARLVRGLDPEPVRISTIGWVVDLGGRRGVARVGPVTLSGPGADLLPSLLHELIDLRGLLETGGVRALRRAPSSVRSLPGLGAWASGWPLGSACPLQRPGRGEAPLADELAGSTT